jgi:translation initiation factor IF-1
MANSAPYLNEIMLGFVMKIIRMDHSTIDIDFLVSHLMYYLEEVSDEELGWRAALGAAILELCALGAEMDEDVIQEVLSSYPFAAHFGKTQEATVALITMVNSGEWDEIKAAVAVSFTQALTMSAECLDDHDIGAELRSEMIEMTVRIFEDDRVVRKAALESLNGKSIRVKRFAALFGG